MIPCCASIAHVGQAPEHAPNRIFNAVAAFSGGRDSSCLLYCARHVLKLSVLHDCCQVDPDEVLSGIYRP